MGFVRLFAHTGVTYSDIGQKVHTPHIVMILRDFGSMEKSNVRRFLIESSI
ncbi:MAG: hypothetical protein AB7T38_16350 [Nitrospirales bacterium]